MNVIDSRDPQNRPFTKPKFALFYLLAAGRIFSADTPVMGALEYFIQMVKLNKVIIKYYKNYSHLNRTMSTPFARSRPSGEAKSKISQN